MPNCSFVNTVDYLVKNWANRIIEANLCLQHLYTIAKIELWMLLLLLLSHNICKILFQVLICLNVMPNEKEKKERRGMCKSNSKNKENIMCIEIWEETDKVIWTFLSSVCLIFHMNFKVPRTSLKIILRDSLRHPEE